MPQTLYEQFDEAMLATEPYAAMFDAASLGQRTLVFGPEIIRQFGVETINDWCIAHRWEWRRDDRRPASRWRRCLAWLRS